MSTNFSHMKRNMERTTWSNPSEVDDHGQALLVRKKHRLLQVRENELLPTQGRLDLRQHQSHQLQRLAEELRAGWLEAPNKLARALEGLYLAYMLGVRGARAEPKLQALEGPTQRGAAGSWRAGEKHRIREEKGRREELTRQQSCHKPQRKSSGSPHPTSSPPDKRKRKRVPLTKANSRRSSDPTSAAGDVSRQEGREKERPREGRKQPTKGAVSPVRDLKDNCPGPRSEVWQEGSSCKRRALPTPTSACRRDKKRWQKELEFAFVELFNTNQKLKKQLSLHMGLKPGESQPSSEEQSCSEAPSPREEAQGEKRAIKAEAERTLTRVPTNPAGDHAHQTESMTHLKTLLSTFQNPKYHSMPTPTYRNETPVSSSESGVSLRTNNPLPCGLEPQQELPEPDDTLEEGHLQIPLHEQTRRVRLMALRQMQSMEMEQRRWKQLEMLDENEYLDMSLEPCSQNEIEEEIREQVSERLAQMNMCSSLEPAEEERRGCGRSSTSLSATSVYDDERNSQMLQDLQQQILEQNKLHKQFVEETRKRLQEFQTIH
ncbi:protein DDC8 homolog [Erinaceus europaeus]|uniref:Protein DDC8 homolog n=1 Tax=Erinaceus europaeus TaxID=9365 RepID=A0ABM3YCN6_ERIEU|nr:protein DDC8 homolog [Erinaceus europaeus]